jgi:hypothetical protein
MRITGEAEGGEALLRESLARVPENAGTRLNLVAMLGNGGCIEMEKWPYATQDWKDWLQFKRANAKPAVRDRGRTAPAPRR